VSNTYRIEVLGGIYHVNAKAVEGVMAFPDFRHRQQFMDMFFDESMRSNWTCLGYAVVGTHYHVIVQINALTLSTGFQRLNSRYARWFNRIHGRRGAFWRGDSSISSSRRKGTCSSSSGTSHTTPREPGLSTNRRTGRTVTTGR
jgi:hypothetical protein